MFKEINFIIWRTPQEFEGGVNSAGQEKEGKMRSQNFHNHKYLKKRAKSETVEVETLPPTYFVILIILLIFTLVALSSCETLH